MSSADSKMPMLAPTLADHRLIGVTSDSLSVPAIDGAGHSPTRTVIRKHNEARVWPERWRPSPMVKG
jgi:hypothetical protein